MPLSDDQERQFIAELRTILPDLFDEEEDAQTLVADIGRPRSRQTPWRNAESFWAGELRELGRGVAPDGISSLIRAAAERLPGNRPLARMSAQVDAPDTVPGATPDPPHDDAQDNPASKPDLPTRIIEEPARQFHVLTLIGSDRHDDFLRLVRQRVDPDAEQCYLTTSQSGQLPQSAVLIADPGGQADAIEQQMLTEVRGWGADVAVEFQASDVRPHLLRRLVVQGTDNRSFELRNVPSTTPLSEIARAVLENYTDDNSHGHRGRVRTAIDRVGANGSADRLDLSHTLGDAGIANGDELRLATEAIAGTVTPALWRTSVLRARAQIYRYASNHAEFFIVDTDDDNLPTRYTVEFTARGFAPPVDLEAWPLKPRLQSDHQVEIILPADFPVRPPAAIWLSDIFHPNVLAAPFGNAPKGFACLGALTDAYRPDLDFGELCQMLVDMSQYRRYETRQTGEDDGEGYLNVVAARWARTDACQHRIIDRGGVPMAEMPNFDEKEDSMASLLDIRPIEEDWEKYEDEG